jgi:hypothetical protein
MIGEFRPDRLEMRLRELKGKSQAVRVSVLNEDH